ncbi:LysM peptidoglycan-binding domain-containing protein [Peijinzhouia sedimentorum]
MKRLKFLLLSIAIFAANGIQAHQADSVGYEMKDGKVLVHYKVGEKETLFSIAKQYESTMYDIIQLNPGADQGLRFGQILKVPYNKPFTPKSERVVTAEIPVNRVHKVGPAETIFSISRKYGVNVADIRRWNGLKNDNIGIGQSIVVAAPPSELVADTRSTPTVNQQSSISTPMPQEEEFTYEIGRVPVNETGKNMRVSEKGIAEVITGTGESAKFLALHKSAPVGTIIQVTNPMNNISIFVRVIGKLPPTGENDKIVIKLSQSAYERLNAIDKKFLVDLSYIE